MAWFDGFHMARHLVDGVAVNARTGGRLDGPPLLLAHGFPQTHVMWHRVAQRLAERWFLVLPDLRGYGDSARPEGGGDHAAYSKRAMAADLVGLMRQLGHPCFAVAGHDRGGRVAHRLALDHPGAVSRLALIDIAPTLDMYAATDMAFASAYYHWFHLIQPAPFPERMIAGDARGYLHAKLGGWGSKGLGHIEPEAIHSACEDYRASAGIDLDHDRASRARGDKIACDTLVMCGERGVVQRMFKPVELWQAQCHGTVTGRPMPAGHFIPEECPGETAQALAEFFTPGAAHPG
jgi:haloacetate dehalogenase